MTDSDLTRGGATGPWLRDQDVADLRAQQFADPPYVNLTGLLNVLPPQYGLRGEPPRDLEVEVQVISRRAPFAILAGIPRALEMLERCTGEWSPGELFINRYDDIDVWSLDDGAMVGSDEMPLHSTPVLVLIGAYRLFAHLKTPLLGTLARASRVATNTYRLLNAAAGKPVFTFSARYDLHETQAMDGYAYAVGVAAHNQRVGGYHGNSVSTPANARFTGASIVGTLSHEAIACFGGDVGALMVKFAEVAPIDRLRVALVDFHNDCHRDSLHAMRVLFQKALEARRHRLPDDERRYRLDGVRVDTSAELTDVSCSSDLNRPSSRGVSPALIRSLRKAIDGAWQQWELKGDDVAFAAEWCRQVKIIVSGGFNETRIASFEAAKVPVDAYGVGTAMLSNCVTEASTTDFSAGVTRIRRSDDWVEIAKAGRRRSWDARLIQR